MPIPRLGEKWRPLLRHALAEVADIPRADAAPLETLAELLDHLALWNDRASLTRATTAEELIDVCLIDALMLTSQVPATTAHWIDVGAGAGALGLVAAILAPQLRVTLVDSHSQRVAFLRTMGSALAPGRTEALRASSESLASGGWDIAISRGPMAPAEWLCEGARLSRRGVWLFPEQDDPPSAPGWRSAHEVHYMTPFTQAERVAAFYVPEPSTTR